MKTSYNRNFYKPDGSNSNDIKIDRIMRNTINAAFHTVEHSRNEMPKIEYDLT